MSRLACCCCGSLQVEVSGEPNLVAVCHCTQCQRRTGSGYSVIAFFDADKVRTEGTSRIFTREGQKHREVHFHFCPICGSSVFWEADFRPGEIGISVGAFADPEFPPPTISAWEQTKHPWAAFHCDLLHLSQQRT